MVVALRNRFNHVPQGEDFGIIAEPYFDLDFDEVFYLTDTGRSWNNSTASIRDKVEGTAVYAKLRRAKEVRCQRSEVGGQRSGRDRGQMSAVRCQRTKDQKERSGIKDTHHLIEKIQNNELPDKIMLSIHPQRWFDYGYNWYKELLMQNVKNVIKRYLLKFRP